MLKVFINIKARLLNLQVITKKDNKMKKYKYTPKTKEELQALVEDESIYLGDIDTSEITDMSYLFANSTRKDFSGIEKWNTSKVITMAHMFSLCRFFNQDISRWDVGEVENMSYMFHGCHYFNQPL
ncbi:TPA: BspA family leucine-rich repeat surface protein, partial [Campylobacter coli]|nr:BspA family leucine-rich repeat surface protein [Campylobacter coli]